MVKGIISKRASSGKIKNGFVQTPPYVTEKLLDNEEFKGSILEPCCGKGAISEVFKKRIEWLETKIGWLFAWYVWEKGYEGEVKIMFV